MRKDQRRNHQAVAQVREHLDDTRRRLDVVVARLSKRWSQVIWSEDVESVKVRVAVDSDRAMDLYREVMRGGPERKVEAGMVR